MRLSLLVLTLLPLACRGAERTTESSRPVESSAPVASSAPTASAAPEMPSSPPAKAPSPSASAPPPSTVAVRVVEWGLHIGGGPNDDENKGPIRRSIGPHFDDLGRCFALAEKHVAGDFGVDLMIPKDGGKAKVTRPRTPLGGDAFKQCVVTAFEAIEFEKPKSGLTTGVNYSVRFTPK